MGHYNSFIVRLWSDEHERLHGTIEHVATRQRLVFLDLDAISEFIRSHLSAAVEINEPNSTMQDEQDEDPSWESQEPDAE